MTRRLLIQAGSDSPFRVSSTAAGDAGSASPFNLIFDGNQSPLRKSVSGWVVANGLAFDNLAPAFYTKGPAPVYSTPAGQYPIFTILTWLDAVPGGVGRRAQTPFHIPAGNGSGFGGSLSGGYFYGINFNRQSPPVSGVSGPGPFPVNYINYLIFQNYG